MFQTEINRIIDFHTHTFPDKIVEKTIVALEKEAGITAKSDGTILGLLDSMKRAGVDLSVIMPVVTRPEQFQTVNNFAAQMNEAYDGAILSFGGIHPDTQNYKQELKYIKSLGLKGIKLHPDYQKTMIDDIGYCHIIDYASELDLVVVVHAGIDIGIPHPVHCPPQKSLEVINKLQPPKLVLAHMGGWKQWDQVEEYLVGKNVYLDCAFCSDYMTKEQFERMVKEHGADKVLFASDSPWEDPRRTLEWVESTSLTKEMKRRMYMQNACQLLGIRPEAIGRKKSN